MKVIIHAPISRRQYIEGQLTCFTFSRASSVRSCVEQVKQLSFEGKISTVEIETNQK